VTPDLPPLGPASEIELLVVVPVFNEQASIEKVVLEWHAELGRWTDKFALLLIDDGSKDGTRRILESLRGRLGSSVEVLSRANRGHGQTCLEGYRRAIAAGIPYVFQIDSDGQCDPRYFASFWQAREQCDVLLGVRTRRDDGLRRVIASGVLRLWVYLLAGVWCRDANVPFRLMRTTSIADKVARIGPDFFLANVALSVLVVRDRRLRLGHVAIGFRVRYGGEPSIPLRKFLLKALELRAQLRRLTAEIGR
jgi:dolichol-phosphate mannosyltransferase